MARGGLAEVVRPEERPGRGERVSSEGGVRQGQTLERSCVECLRDGGGRMAGGMNRTE